MTDWKNIHLGFTPELQKEWEIRGFNYETTRDWIRSGLSPQDAGFAHWLETEEKTSDWMINFGNETELREQYINNKSKIIYSSSFLRETDRWLIKEGSCSKHYEMSRKELNRSSSEYAGESEETRYQKWKTRRSLEDEWRQKEQEKNRKYCLNCLNKLTKSEIFYCLSCAKKKEIRNILIIGRTKNGKSSLANTLVNTLTDEDNFKEVFKESTSSISETKKPQEGIFEWKGISYRVVDTIGLGDTSESSESVILNIAKTIGMMKEGISHILFIIKDTFTEEEKNNFKLIKEIMLEGSITSYVTIIRTHFEAFRNKKKCELDKKELLSESKDIAEIIKSCKGLIHVDNPSLNISELVDSDADEDEKRKSKEEMEEKIRQRKNEKRKSREKILNHLESIYQGNYKPKGWDEIHSKVDDYVSKEAKNKDLAMLQEDKKILVEETKILLAQQQAISKPWLWLCLML